MVFAAMWASGMETDTTREITLPQPVPKSHLSAEEALSMRRSVRHFTEQAVTLEAIAQLLWAAQGITVSDGGRTAPSAGALYPLETYLVVGDVMGLGAGIYRYQPRRHALTVQATGDLRERLSSAALWQAWVARAAAVLVITAVYARTAGKYGARAERYVHIEVGHAAQNVYLQAQSLGLGTLIVGSFKDEEVHDVLGLPANEAPLALMPLGYPERPE